MGAEEKKYVPNFGNMDLSEIRGTAKAAKNMADIMFKRFTKDIKVVIDSVMFNNDNYKLIKDIKKNVEENIVKYKEILTHLEGLYSARANKYKDEVKELTENFKIIEKRRCTVRTKLKDALEAVEEARNKEQQQRRAEDVPVVLRRGDRDGEKQFKMPTGAHPECISSEFTPLMADNWQGDMKIFIKTCSNLDILSTGEQRTLMKCFVSTALWPQVEVNRAEEIMVCKVGEAYEQQVPIFARKVKFLELTRVKGEGYKEWANK